MNETYNFTIIPFIFYLIFFFQHKDNLVFLFMSLKE